MKIKLLMNKLLMDLTETFTVASLFQCNGSHSEYEQNTLWKQTILGCKIMEILQDVVQFSVTYVYQQQDLQRDIPTEIQMYPNASEVDLYARPMSLRADVIDHALPVGAIFNWNFGFTISYPDMSYRHFYSKPFSRRVWNILYVMAFFCSLFFYFLKRWENKVKKGPRVWECSYGYELLMVLGAYCQHIPPIDAHLLSRRTAYFVFFIFGYIVYTYYTSNLLSHLVNDRNHEISLEELLHSDIECVLLENVKDILNNTIVSIFNGNKMSVTFQKILILRNVSIEEGLRAVRTSKTALLSDYDTITPYIRTVFNSNEMCNLANIDVVTYQKYLFVSKSFPYVEQFKVSILRIKEAGILSRLVRNYYDSAFECTPRTHVQTQLLQIMHLLIVLGGAYVLSIVILCAEIVCYRRYKVWPYVN